MRTFSANRVYALIVPLCLCGMYPFQTTHAPAHETTVLEFQTALTGVLNPAPDNTSATGPAMDVLDLQCLVAATVAPPAPPDTAPPSDQAAATVPGPARSHMVVAAVILPFARVHHRAALPYVNLPYHSGARARTPQKERYLFQLMPNAPPALESVLCVNQD